MPPARVLASLARLALVALAGCADAPTRVGAATPAVQARFVRGGEVDVIEVRILDRLLARAVDLVAPGGQAQRAFALTSEESPSDPKSASTPTAPLGTSAFQLGKQSTVLLGQIGSTASIRVPDPELYKATWQDWTIRVHLGDPPRSQTVSVPAPRPDF